MRHVMVYQEAGRFCGWPANHGVWHWDDEILVGFLRCTYRESLEDHSYDQSQPQQKVLARSFDGGETWTLETPESLGAESGYAPPCPGGIDFTHPDFALRCNYADFQISYDRGKTWLGPCALPYFGRELKARTDYIVNGPRDCTLFIAAYEPAGGQDRAFCIRTTDGGRSFAFLSWMTGEPLTHRSVMPSTVRLSETQLVSALRRRENLDGQPGLSRGEHRCWIDVYRSTDAGRSWRFLSKVADTGTWNGNPPSMVHLKDGRLCVAYGYRATPFGIRARLSSDGGETWGDEIILRADGRTWDLGYPRMVRRSDGKLVTVYYFTTEEKPEQHIAATIWDPVAVGR